MFDLFADFLAEQKKQGSVPDRLWERFKRETKDHRLTVVHDDGLYRHLVMAKPGTGIWSWEIATWPGALCSHGDIVDDNVFTRLRDMFDFFAVKPDRFDRDGSRRAPKIDFGYWVEKAHRADGGRVYDKNCFLRWVGQILQDWVDAKWISPNQADCMFADASEPVQNTDIEDALAWLIHNELDSDILTRHNLTRLSDRSILTCFAIHETIRRFKLNRADLAPAGADVINF
ncbi:MAG: hypothetical protein LBG60_01905 [Bifidobacteriaceae bacterium]|nr:hypothetical protein [Bifidobacteriaceae bacterium]